MNDPVNILLVDDQPAKLLSYEAILGGLGNNLLKVASGREALDVLLKQEIAVILLDVNMPDMDGFETASVIREHPRFAKTPIIFVSAISTSDLDRVRGYELGAVDYVFVPVVPEILKAKVAVFVELHRKTLELQALNRNLEQRVVERTSKLQEQESRLRSILESEPECVKCLDQDCCLLEMNPAGLAMMEADSIEQVVGRSVLGIVDEPYREAFRKLTERVFRGERGILEFSITSLKGNRLWLETHAGPFRDASGEIVSLISITRDITGQKQTESELREQQARLQLLVHASNIGLWDWNMVTNEVFFSREWKSQLGYTDDELPNRFGEWESRVHADDLPRTLEAIDDFRAGRRTDYDVEFRLRHKDGSWRWIMTRADLIRGADGQPIRMMGCHVDITERKRTEEKIAQQVIELRQWYEVTLGREDRIRELKREINQLLLESGRLSRYPSQSIEGSAIAAR